jgi:hypothetical protein
MLRWLQETWTGSAIVEFESAFGLAESVERLRAATRRSLFSAVAHEAAVGTVKETRVSLQRVIPMVGNSFKPFFIGRFVASGDKVVLRGSFTIHRFTKLFMTVWFGGLALMTLSMLAAGLHSPSIWVGILFAIGMMGAGLGLVRIGQWFSRRDPAWLSAVIGVALGAPDAASCSATAAVRSPQGLPGHLLSLAILIAVGGAWSLALGIAGLQTFHLEARGVTATYFQAGSAARYLAILLGGLMLGWAYGIYCRHLLAWWVGIGLLALGGLNQLEMLVGGQQDQPGQLILGLMGLPVLAIWGWFWYGQRAHFRRGLSHDR